MSILLRYHDRRIAELQRLKNEALSRCHHSFVTHASKRQATDDYLRLSSELMHAWNVRQRWERRWSWVYVLSIAFTLGFVLGIIFL